MYKKNFTLEEEIETIMNTIHKIKRVEISQKCFKELMTRFDKMPKTNKEHILEKYADEFILSSKFHRKKHPTV